MALTKTPIELSSTPSIVDGGNATAITIDSSERVFIGKTATGLGTSGTEINPNGYVQITEDQSPPLYLNRLSTDGSIVNFYKDTTTVGSIGTAGSGTELYIAGAGTNATGIYLANSGKIVPMKASAISDATQDIGMPSYRWKDLYLSGGAYLGGTAAANKLDDYEEGTHTTTLSFSSGSATLTNNTLSYTKIGQQVIVTGYLSINAISNPSGLMRFTLPFPVGASIQHRAAANVKLNQISSGDITTSGWAIAESNTSTVAIYDGSGTGVASTVGQKISTNTDLRVSVTYVTSA
tara:strand:+ start:429 stop:1307 length:879 start_codon:yes stop_codon:yes gene_type:complete